MRNYHKEIPGLTREDVRMQRKMDAYTAQLEKSKLDFERRLEERRGQA